MATQQYKVLSADYYDQAEGVEVGVIVTATDGENPGFLYITALPDRTLNEPIAVTRASLQRVSDPVS